MIIDQAEPGNGVQRGQYFIFIPIFRVYTLDSFSSNNDVGSKPLHPLSD